MNDTARPLAVRRISSTVLEAVSDAMERAEWRRHVPAGSRVALKPNLCWDLPLPGVQTSPWVLAAVLEVMLPHVADIVVVEAGQITVDADRALVRCGLGRVLEHYGVPFVNMSRGAFVTARLDDGFVLHEVELPAVLGDRVLVTLPVLKTHATTAISGALKNQWGCLRELRHNHHLVVDEAIADVNRLVRPSFAVMDATVGLEGNGPKTGRPRIADLVLASADPVALDSIAARIMGFDPRHIPHLVAAERAGLGRIDIEGSALLGDDVTGQDLGFRPARPGLIQRTEFALRRSRLRRLAFETRILDVLALAARAYNLCWYVAVGIRERRRVLARSRHGQWTPAGNAETGARR